MAKEVLLAKVRKRDGKLVPYKREKIEHVLQLAAESTESDIDAQKLAKIIEQKLERAYAGKSGKHTPDVEEIQDLVEETLMESGFHKAARHFILYREERASERSAKSALIGKQVRTNLSINALKLLRERYLLRDEARGWFESPNEMFERVARAVSDSETVFGVDETVRRRWKNRFKRVMKNLDFLPNSPCLMNAGTQNQQLASSIAIPLADDLDAIYKALHHAAKMQQAGCGTGFNFSTLRQKGASVKGLPGVASGPLSFLRLFSESARTVKQAGRREGGNLAMLDIAHPDILNFITAKAKKGLENFNLSVLLSDAFINDVVGDREYAFRDVQTGEELGFINAKQVFDLIVARAWTNADPGVLFKDRMGGGFCATSACAEFLLAPYEQGFLGSINLANFVTPEKEVDWKRLKEVIVVAVRFLDDMIEASKYPIRQAEAVTKKNRKIGLGVMGLAHMLIQLDLAYDSEEGVERAGEVLAFIRREAQEASVQLAQERGPYPSWKSGAKARARNASLLAVSPTGSISMMAETSSGIEPLFSVSYVKKVLGGEEFYYIDPYLQERLEKLGLYDEELVERIANFGLSAVKEIPDSLRRLFVTSHDIAPEWHVRMQAAIQKHVDNAVSKTVNLPADATLLDVENVFLLAWKLGCKGCTIYRDGSMGEQVLTSTELLVSKDRGSRRSVREELKEQLQNKSLSEFGG